MRYTSSFLFVLVLLISCATKPEIYEQEKTVNSFFAAYAKDGSRKAVRDLLSSNKYITAQDADTVGIRLERYVNNLGAYRGMELIQTSSYGKSISFLAYTVKYERQPLRFKFTFYDPGDGLILHDFRWETNFLQEMDETVKAYRLKANLDLEDE